MNSIRRPRLPASLLLGLLIAASSWTALAGPPDHRARTGPILSRLIDGRGAAADAAGNRGPITAAELRHYAELVALDPDSHPPRVRVWMRLDARGRAAAEAMGIRLEGRAGDLASASVPLPRLAALAAQPGVEWMQASRRLRAELNQSIPEVRGDLAAEAYHARGVGTVIGVIDDGIDIHHQDFRKPDGSTRIRALWNQADNCGTPPPGFGYGCYLNEADINLALSEGAGLVGLDSIGHGSHVAGIAAGDGSATGHGQLPGTFVGMAPEADLVVVKHTVNLVSCPFPCDAGDALVFIDQQASGLGLPWVANLSLGQDLGAHDGSESLELVIDAITGPGIPGKAVVKSAGNSRGVPFHIARTVDQGQTKTNSFELPNYTPTPGLGNDGHAFTLYYDGGDALCVGLEGPSGFTTSLCTGDGVSAFGTPDGVVILEEDAPTASGARVIYFEINDLCSEPPDPICGSVFPPPQPGPWQLHVTGDDINDSGRYHAWIWFSSLGGAVGLWDAPDLSTLITIPGTAHNVTTVGAYVSKTVWLDIDNDPVGFDPAPPLGSVAFFSSPGPTRDGRVKPDLGAPGQAIVSALASEAAAGTDPIQIVQDGVHAAQWGTSFAAPHVTGLYALMLGLNPGLDAIQLRDLAQAAARSDGDTGAVPNNDWGAGKIDAKAALDQVVKPVTNVLFEADTTRLTWDDIPDLASSYNVYRGNVALLDGTFHGNCIAQGRVVPFLNTPTAPAPGKIFFYLVTGVKDGIEGLRGFASDGTPRAAAEPCPGL